MAEYNPEMAPTYTGKQPGSIRSFFNQLLGTDEGVDRYEDVYGEGVPSYDIASGDVRPIGRRAIRYGDAPSVWEGAEATPIAPEAAPDEFANAGGTVSGGPVDVSEFSDPDAGFAAVPDQIGPPPLDWYGNMTNADANRMNDVTYGGELDDTLPTEMDLEGKGPPPPAAPNPPLDLTKHSPEFRKDVGPIKPIVQIPDVDQGGNQAGFVQEASPSNPSGAVSLSRRGALQAGLNKPETGKGIWDWITSGGLTWDKRGGGEDNEPLEFETDLSDLNIAPTNARATPRPQEPDIEGAEIDRNSLNPLTGMDITGDASLPPGVMNQLDQTLSTPVPPAVNANRQQQIATSLMNPAVPQITPTPLPMTPPPPPVGAANVQQAPPLPPAIPGGASGPPQGASGAGPGLPDAPISNVRPPTLTRRQKLKQPPNDAQQGGFNLMDTIMNMISRDPAAKPSGGGRGIPSIMKTLTNPPSRNDSAVATNTPRFQGASIPSPQPNAIPQILQDFQNRYGPKR